VKPIVLDTCVLIAGLLKPFGASGVLVDAFFRDRLKLAWTNDIIAEYGEVMARDEFGIELNECIAVMLKLRSNGAAVTSCLVPDAK
jgi:predicted nucleic acid-binding protein